jgi:hypothetical protein
MIAAAIWVLGGCSRDNNPASAGPEGGEQPNARTITDLLDTNNATDYLVVAADPLTDAALRFADYHNTNTLDDVSDGAVVKFSSIAAQFPGRADSSLKTFLDYAYHSWKNVPLYVLLLGAPELSDGSAGIPLADTSIYNNSDNYFSDIDGDRKPDYALGRIPAKSGSQAMAVLEKEKDFETAFPSCVLFVADDTLQVTGISPFKFEEMMEEIMAMIDTSRFGIDTFYLSFFNNDLVWSDPEKVLARDSLIKVLNRGGRFVSMAGHSSAEQFTDEKVFSIGDVQKLTSTNVFYFCGSNINDLSEPDCIGSALLLNDGAGACAVMAADGDDHLTSSEKCQKAFFSNLGKPEFESIGKLFLGSRTAIFASYNSVILLGDPAMRVQ